MNPSNANRRVACPGSRALEELYPVTQESPAVKEGIAAHWVAVQYLKSNYNLGLNAPNGEPITKEMLEGADLYWDAINKECDFHELNIEQTIDISNIVPGMQGTPDAWCIKDNRLYIWDYKFGHSYIDVFENWQLLEYISGVMHHSTGDINSITMTIVQPRCYTPKGPVRSWTITAQQMREYEILLQEAEALAMSPFAFQRPNSNCSHCSGRHACQTLQMSALTAVDISMDNSPWELSPTSTGNELRYLKRALDLLESRIIGLSEQARAMIMRGEFVPGFKLEASSGREKWSKPVDEIITLGELFDLDLTKPPEPITPSQARKLGIDDKVLNEYTQRTPSALKLVESKDSRKIFGGKS